jgi:protein SCO1/2
MTPRRRLLLAIALLVALLLLSGCGGSSSRRSGTPAAESKQSQFQGAEATPPKPAPALRLGDSTGRRFDLSSLRGKAVLVTFLYVHCPDVCPLIAGNMHTALRQLGPEASNVKVVAVSTDPKGDRPKDVKEFLAKHQVTGEMRYLLGSKAQLAKVWKAWGIISRPGPRGSNQVGHSAPIYGISASGKITTLYPSNFNPAQIVHDVPVLAKQ